MFSQPSSFGDGKLPMFVFPHSLTFYSDDQSSHKQVLTLYNPYDSPLKFKVLCTAPQKYTVVDAEGTIRPRCCVDVVVRHTDICINNEGATDKFRIQVTEHGQRKIIGKKDINAVLLPTKRSEGSPAREDRFLSLPQQVSAHTQEASSSRRIPDTPHEGRSTGGPSFIVILTAFVCIAALMLPLHGDRGSSMPEYLHLSVNQKLIAAYVLGLVTMLILHV